MFIEAQEREFRQLQRETPFGQSLYTLRDKIKAGDLSFYLVIAPPRSVSTAFTFGLVQSPSIDVGLHETDRLNILLDSASKKKKKIFDFNIPDEVDVLEKCLFACNELEQKNGHCIVIKEMASGSLVDLFSARWVSSLKPVMQHCKGIIFLTREPIQLSESIGNVKSGKGRCDTRVVSEKMLHFEDDFINPSKIYRTIQKYFPEIPTMVVEGDVFRTNPEESYQKICAHFGLQYTPAMVHGWGNIHPTTGDYWTERACQSKAISLPDVDTQFPETFSDKTAQSLRRDYSHYLFMLHATATAWPKVPSMLQSWLEKPTANGVALMTLEPPTAYAMMVSCNLSELSDKEKRIRDHFLRSLRRNFKSFTSIYDIIDGVNGKPSFTQSSHVARFHEGIERLSASQSRA